MDWKSFISQYDLIYETPPLCWQDGLVLGNGSLGAVFFAPHALEWIVNKTDVIDARTHGVQRVIPPDEAARRVREGTKPRDFEREERGIPAPEGIGPKSCCRLLVDLGMVSGAGNRSALPDVHARLSLHDATLRVALDKHLCHPRVESFVCANENLLVISVRDVSPIVAYRTRIDLSRPEDVELDSPRLSMERERLILRMQMPEGLSYVVALQIVPRPSRAYREDILPRLRPQHRAPVTGEAQVRVAGNHGIGTVGGDFDLYLTVVTSRDATDPDEEAHRRLDRAASRSTADLHAAHGNAWADFWKQSWVELGDKDLEQLFYGSLYALRTAYRGAPMSGLLGLCYGPSPGPVQLTPWTGDLHHDQNVQCPFFPVHALNHSELFDAYLDTYESFLPEARRLAHAVWQAEGAHFDMAFNAQGRSVLGGVGHYRFFFGGSYVALMHCLCWRYRRDVDQLRQRIYPFLREVLDFYWSIARKGDDGLFHLWPAHAPELDITDCSDPVQNISMLKVCLQTALEAAAVLSDDGPHVARWRDLLQHLPAYPVAESTSGSRVLDAVGVPPHHHISQVSGLYPVYPCAEVDASSPAETIALYQRTLDAALEQIAQKVYATDRGFYFQCAWQCFFLAMSSLRLGRVAEFWDTFLPLFLRSYSKPNGLLSHDATVIVNPASSEANLRQIPARTLQDVGEEMPVFEAWCGHDGGSSPNPLAKAFSAPLIEASADYLTMITETLLQSHNGIIRVFPAWPQGRLAQFFHLVAEGNVLVSARTGAQGVEFIHLERGKHGRDSTVRIFSPWTKRIESWTLSAESLTLTATGPAPAPALEPRQPDSQAEPRILYQDANGPLWLGRKI